MGGWLKYLGFALPITIALDNSPSPGPDGRPTKGVCSFCKVRRNVMYTLGDGRRMCSVDLDDLVNSRRVQGVRSSRRRPLDHPVEVVNPHREDDGFPALYDKWIN